MFYFALECHNQFSLAILDNKTLDSAPLLVSIDSKQSFTKAETDISAKKKELHLKDILIGTLDYMFLVMTEAGPRRQAAVAMLSMLMLRSLLVVERALNARLLSVRVFETLPGRLAQFTW